MYSNNERLIIFDADGTTVDSFSAIDKTFSLHGMDIGDFERFQKRRKLLKYLGGLREFPLNLQKQVGKQSRKRIIATLTEIYREEALLYPGVAQLIKTLMATPGVRIGVVTRNVTNEPATTLRIVFARHDIDAAALDFITCVPLGISKSPEFKSARTRLDINPARAYACGDEHSDYAAAIACGMHPFIVSYGFEDHERLCGKFEVPEDVISRTPEALCARVRNGLDLQDR